MSIVNEYLIKLNVPQRTELERIRSIVQRTVPEAKESMSYGMPVFKYKEKYLIGFAAFKNHMSIFPGSEGVEAVKDTVAGFKTSKGTIQFTTDNPLPKPLVEKLLRLRVTAITGI